MVDVATLNESKQRALNALDSLEVSWQTLMAEANTLDTLVRYRDQSEWMELLRTIRQDIKPPVYRIPFPITQSLFDIQQRADLPLAGGEIKSASSVHLNIQDNLFYQTDPRYIFDGIALCSANAGEPVVIMSRHGDRSVGEAELYLWVRELSNG